MASRRLCWPPWYGLKLQYEDSGNVHHRDPMICSPCGGQRAGFCKHGLAERIERRLCGRCKLAALVRFALSFRKLAGRGEQHHEKRCY